VTLSISAAARRAASVSRPGLASPGPARRHLANTPLNRRLVAAVIPCRLISQAPELATAAAAAAAAAADDDDDNFSEELRSRRPPARGDRPFAARPCNYPSDASTVIKICELDRCLAGPRRGIN